MIDFRKFIFFLLITFSGSLLFAQQEKQMEMLLQNAQEILYSDPEQAVKSVQIITENSTISPELIQACLLMSKSYLVMGKYDKALEVLYKAQHMAEITNDTSSYKDISSLFSEIMEIINVENLTDTYKFKDNTKPKDKTLESFLKSQAISAEQDFKYAKVTKGILSTQIGKQLIDEFKPDLAQIYFEIAVKNLQGKKNMNYWEMVNMIEYSEYFFSKKEFQKAIVMLNQCIRENEKFGNVYFEMRIYNKLVKNYLAVSAHEDFKNSYFKMQVSYTKLNREITSVRNFTLENISQEGKSEVSAIQQKGNKISMILMGAAAFLLLSGIYIGYINYSRIKHKKELITYLQLTKKEVSREEVPQKHIVVSDDTEKNLLQKLEKFEKGNKFLSKDMSLPLLASHFSTNTKYLSSIINKHKGKNFSTYINELRINYIIEKLKTHTYYQNYKISYLAEESGFASHNSFTFAFKKQIGMSPLTFIEFLKQEKKHEDPQI